MSGFRNEPRHSKFLALVGVLAIAVCAALAKPLDVSSPPSSTPGSLEDKVYKLIAKADADSLAAIGPSVVPPVLSCLENQIQPDVISWFSGGRMSRAPNPERMRLCSIVLARLGEPSAKAVVEVLKRRLMNKPTFELNDEYVSVLAMIGQSSIKPIVQLAESGDAATSKAGLMMLMAVLNKSDQLDVGTMPSPSSFMGFGGDWIDLYGYSGSALSASLPASLIPKLLDKSGKPISIPRQNENPKWAMRPVYTALGMIDHPSRPVVNALRDCLKHRPHSESYDVGYDTWRRAAMSVGRVSLRDGNVLTDHDADEIVGELEQAIQDNGGYGGTAAAADAICMLAVRHPKYAAEVAHLVRMGTMPGMSLMTAAGAANLIDAKDAKPIVEALLNMATRRVGEIEGVSGGLQCALAHLDSRFASKTVPVLIKSWRYMNNEPGATPLALMETGPAGKAAMSKLKEFAALDDEFEFYYSAYRCLGCPASAVLVRQTFADCADSFVGHPHRCHLMADPGDPMDYASPEGPAPNSVSSKSLMVSFVDPDKLQFEALLAAAPYINEFQRFRPVDKIALSVVRNTEGFRRTRRLNFASTLYAKALQLYAKSSGDQRTLMPDAVRNYALVLEATGKHQDAVAMMQEFKKTGTLVNVPR